jgi:hypothetical protein
MEANIKQESNCEVNREWSYTNSKQFLKQETIIKDCEHYEVIGKAL